jgi:uncharacterized protein (TIGR02246 family)
MTSNNATAVRSGEDSAVRAVFDELSKAWADGDVDAFTAWFTEGATVVLPGFIMRDRAAVRTGMATAFDTQLRGSTRTHVLRDIRFVGAGVAVVSTDSVTAFPAVEAEQEDWATWVLTEHDGRWLVESYHGCSRTAS